MAGDYQVLLLPAPHPSDDPEQLLVVQQLCGLQVPDSQHSIIIASNYKVLHDVKLSYLIPLQVLIIVHINLLEMLTKLIVRSRIDFTV